MNDQSYTPTPIKRNRRTKSEMIRLRDGLSALAELHNPLTIRQLFYRAVATSLIDKTQKEYDNVVVRLVGLMREEGTIPFEWIIDNTRWMRKPNTHHGLESMLVHTQRTYRRSIWDDQQAYVEIWCESDSIAGILYDVTSCNLQRLYRAAYRFRVVSETQRDRGNRAGNTRYYHQSIGVCR
jgi:hypothetical protein